MNKARAYRPTCRYDNTDQSNIMSKSYESRKLEWQLPCMYLVRIIVQKILVYPAQLYDKSDIQVNIDLQYMYNIKLKYNVHACTCMYWCIRIMLQKKVSLRQGKFGLILVRLLTWYSECSMKGTKNLGLSLSPNRWALFLTFRITQKS